MKLFQSAYFMSGRCPDSAAPNWTAGHVVPVRELLALASAYYYELVPPEESSTKFFAMWSQVREYSNPPIIACL